ncbi:uncharacterized protein LOC120775814 [Bactrocera tryoni]|uniref:uncharacterized protein LOC120775814 n=1 Tax=Bactrocera tryoni TaxID=59916 RepID=UPI001A99A5A5|nr:uncharacterized protein LOC120775814 [Bactrocera tryoni]XP_039962102.1 uncharacterized protein LOC120775814 [Bactrocera tryoni]
MERRCTSENKPILVKSALNSSDGDETETIILSNCDLEQSDIDVITTHFAYATYLDVSYNEKIAFINFKLTPTTLYLKNCTNLHEIKYSFSSCTLKILDISGCPMDYEEHFMNYDFPMLETLKLSWQPKADWRKLLGKLKALKSLTVEDFDSRNTQVTGAKGTTQSYEALLLALSDCKHIKAVTLGGMLAVFDISHLSKLADRKLSFHIRHESGSHLNRLHKLQNLDTVYLEHVNDVTDVDLLDLIKSCKNLSKLTLDYCNGVTKAFIFSAAEFLRERDKDEPLRARLNLEMCGCVGITESIQEDPQYAKAESALSLILFFECKHPMTSYRNDLIIPYPPPNVQLSIYVLFEIYKRLINQPVSQRFASVCEDFENAAIEEERHLKIIACRRAKIVHNDIYDAYLEITSERKDFFKELRCANATKMVLNNRALNFDTILEDFPNLKRLKLLNCIIAEDEFPRNKQYNNISDLDLSGANAFCLWQSISILFPHVRMVNLTDASLENPLGMEMLRIFRFEDRNVFRNITRFSVDGTILCDEDVEFLANLTRLESLSIIRNSKVTGKHIAELSSVKELQLSGCENLSHYYLVDILNSLSLSSLDIRHSTFTDVAMHLTNLMWLRCETLVTLKLDWRLEHTITTLQTLQSLKDIEVRNFNTNPCAACIQNELLPVQDPNFQIPPPRCTCADEPETRLIQRFFRTLAARISITKLTLEAEVLCRNLNYLPHLQQLTHLSIIAKKIGRDGLCVPLNFPLIIGQLANLEYLYLSRFYYCFDYVIYIVSRCSKLNEVRLKQCVGFSDVVAYDLVEVLKRKRTKDQLPFRFYMLNLKDDSSETCSENSRDSQQEVNRFEDIADYIKVIFL